MEEKRDARGLTEAEAIARYRSRNYPKPAMTADIAIFARQADQLQVLLIRRKGHPYLGKLALPGGFANENEPIEQTAARELKEETGVSGLPVKLVGVYSAPGRDPRGWVVSVVYMAVAEAEKLQVKAGDDAAEVLWAQIEPQGESIVLRQNGRILPLEELAFDHAQILRDALKSVM